MEAERRLKYVLTRGDPDFGGTFTRDRAVELELSRADIAQLQEAVRGRALSVASLRGLSPCCSVCSAATTAATWGANQ